MEQQAVVSKQASKQAEEDVKQEEEEDEGIWIRNDDVVDMFPQMKEVREYLLDNYPLTRKEQKLSRTGDYGDLPIKFYYDDGMEDGEYIKGIQTSLFFEETVTKKQMVEAINYVSEKMKEIFPEDDEITIRVVAFVGYTEDGILQKDMWEEREGIGFDYKRNNPEDAKWRLWISPDEYIPFDPASVKEGEKPKIFAGESAEPEQPEQQTQEEAPKEEQKPAPTGLGGAKLSELKDYLNSADVEEFSFEEGNGIYTSTGIDPTKTYGYTAVTGSDKETLQGVVYMITKKENLTNDEYLELCEMYLTAGATFGYAGVDTDKVTSFIENNMETVLSTGESKSQTLGSLSFTITYANNTASLIILNPNEQ